MGDAPILPNKNHFNDSDTLIQRIPHSVCICTAHNYNQMVTLDPFAVHIQTHMLVKLLLQQKQRQQQEHGQEQE